MVGRILVTGSREWGDRRLTVAALRHAWRLYPGAVLVHGDAEGLDRMAAGIWESGGLDTEPHPASRFANPRDRNQHMVGLGADLCLAFATRWASGTGMCARMARKAGIPVLDYGVDTRMEARRMETQAAGLW